MRREGRVQMDRRGAVGFRLFEHQGQESRAKAHAQYLRGQVQCMQAGLCLLGFLKGPDITYAVNSPLVFDDPDFLSEDRVDPAIVQLSVSPAANLRFSVIFDAD